eukprot:CAMPEP_0172518810 /NCGR_PEP_ID=MMETSP1066-20121228/291036_1 /TAXON_ID=671091 /ORGANISM="Coscinodiscus wailesii, Strain CCMP2513" /LENGTH=60 /DNA_ID=CAMNT_0013301261 /DNA_START=2360 /DNA_END=2542 /DNA_ORIENTATION=-
MAVAQCVEFDGGFQTTTSNGGFLFRCRRGEIIAVATIIVGGLFGCEDGGYCYQQWPYCHG